MSKDGQEPIWKHEEIPKRFRGNLQSLLVTAKILQCSMISLVQSSSDLWSLQKFRSDLWSLRKFCSAVRFSLDGFAVAMSCYENLPVTLSDYENCEKVQIWKDSLCKSMGRFLRRPRKERYDLGGFSKALGSIYKRREIREKREAESRGEHKSLEDDEGTELPEFFFISYVLS